MDRSRAFVFTSFDADHVPQWAASQMKYLVFQKEKCPETGNIHWQGYVEFKNQILKKNVHKLLQLSSAHASCRRGTPEEAAKYCKKDESSLGSRAEFGSISAQGKRSDLLEFTDGIVAGDSMLSLASAQPTTFVRYGRGLMQFASMLPAPFREDIKVTYVWGPPGVGKSRHVWGLVREQYEQGLVYIAKDHPLGWFDGYAGQESVYFEDFGGAFPYKDILQLLDRYPCTQWVKGGSVPIKARSFWFSANQPPEAFYSGQRAWLRRITEVIHVDVIGEAAAPQAVAPSGVQSLEDF